MNGFYMKCNTGLEWVKKTVKITLISQSFCRNLRNTVSNILQYIKKAYFGSCQTSMLGFSAKIDNTARKVSKYGVISGQYFPVRIQKNTDHK